MKPVKVLYIAGPSRSGSTLLSSILGEIPGFFNAGEVIDFWDRGFLNNGHCGCGVPFNKCAVWEGVLDEVFSKSENFDAREMVGFRDRNARSWRVSLYLALPGQLEKMKKRFHPFLAQLGDLYRGIIARTESKVIVDSSKNVGYAYLLSLVPGIEMYCLHLVRDSRATAYSWLRKKSGLHQQKPGKTSLVWISRNLTAGLIPKYRASGFMRLRYEDFVAAPRHTIERVLSFIQEESNTLPFATDTDVELSQNHSIYGNPDRFKTGRRSVKLDDAWRQNIRTPDYALVTALTWPLLIRYGYPLLK